MKTSKIFGITLLIAIVASTICSLVRADVMFLIALSLLPVMLVIVIHQNKVKSRKRRLNAAIEELHHREMYNFYPESEESNEAMIDALIEQQRNELRNRFKRIDCQ